jgi:class 3 adenylate cyclase
MATRVGTTRRNAALLPWLRGAVFGASAYAAFAALPFYPPAAAVAIAAVAAALGVGAPNLGVLALVVALALPLAAGDLVVGALFLLVGVLAVQFLAGGGGRAFVVVALAFLASVAHAQWALPALAGYALGASEGAVVALVAAFVAEAAGIVLGRPFVGVLATGASHAIVDVARVAATPSPLTFAWLPRAAAAVDPDAVVKSLSAVRLTPALVVQPLLWGACAMAAGLVRPKGRGRVVAVAAAAALAAGLLGAVSIATASFLRVPTPPIASPVAVLVAAAVAAAVAALGETVFREEQVAAPAAQPVSVQSEDADVDELLRLIASAEEQLEERHSTDAVVMITDMKAFSKMTEEHGTFNTAKLVQRHRDLLLPLIERGGGHGKSTGGDGLVAAFSSADDAMATAVEMQRRLKEDNAGRPEEKRVQIRIGLASGDIIVDRTGCPFIGEGLNLAARVMALGDGGQVFATHDVVDGAASLPAPVVPHGEFRLKNIARPVPVEEVLWEEGQAPRRPQVEQGAA